MIGIIADDITGANDIGTMFAKVDYRTYVYSYSPSMELDFSHVSLPDVLILDTDSRFDEPAKAYNKVYGAAKKLQELGCTHYFKKTCSACRGNVGAELDAVLDALGKEFAVVVLGFPKNGRTTVDGVHYVNGRRLEESEFRHDPVHPMTKSNLVEILQAQTKRNVGLIRYATVAQGPSVIRKELARLKKCCNYVIADVTSQECLASIAEAVREESVLGGSSGIAEELAQVLSGQSGRGELSLSEESNPAVLIAVGSLMPQAKGQIEYVQGQGVAAFELVTAELFDPVSRESVMANLVDKLCLELSTGRNALLYSSNSSEAVESTRSLGTSKGLSKTEISRLVSDSLAEVVRRCVTQTRLRRLIVAGGDTSDAVCGKLGVGGMQVWEEIEPGIPSCYTFSSPRYLMVLKAGSYGTPEFFAKAIAHLQVQ